MAEITVEVVYGTADKQRCYTLVLPEPSSARQAVNATPILFDFPEAQPNNAPLGVFGKRVADDYPLRDGDRVEVYRPLLADPKEARRKRAAAKARQSEQTD